MAVDSSLIPPPFPPPTPLRLRYERLDARRQTLLAEKSRHESRLAELNEYLAVAPAVESALETLSHEMFGKLAEVLEMHLTRALQEVLGQPISLRVVQDFKRGGATLRFHIERDGQREDIMLGTGGSVANILSVGLRLLALAKLDPKKHRPFLVLDEQDCWLAPDLVPNLVKIVHDAGKEMQMQVIMISHHAASSFERYADRIYRLNPSADGVKVELEDLRPMEEDEA